MKILVAAPDLGEFFPIGHSYIIAALKEAGHEVAGLNMRFDQEWEEQDWHSYDYIATGGLACSYNDIKRIIDKAKNQNRKTILGGGIVSSEPKLMTTALRADYAVIGEGEQTIVEFLECIENRENVESVPGMAFVKNGQFFITSTREPIKDINLIPLPDYDSLGFSRYVDEIRSSDRLFDLFDDPRAYPLVGSRSCPFQCTFCYHTTGSRYRMRSVDSIMEELQVVIPKYRINIIDVLDELFSSNEKRVREFCEKFKTLSETIPWEIKWFANFRVDNLSADLLGMVRDAGCYLVSYGFESYHPVILKSMKKRITPEQIHKAIHLSVDQKLSIVGNFIFGDIAETEETAGVTLDFWKAHPEAGILLLAVLPFPGSELWRYGLCKGIINDRLDYILEHMHNPINLTQMTDAQHHRMLFNLHKMALKHNLRAVILSVGPEDIKVKCPWCNTLIHYQNFDIASEIHNSVSLKPNLFFYNRPVFCRHCRLRFWVTSRVFRVVVRILYAVLSSWTVYGIVRRAASFLRKLVGLKGGGRIVKDKRSD